MHCPRIGLVAAIVASVSLVACTLSGSSYDASQSQETRQSQPVPSKLSIRAGYLVPWDARGIATIEQGNGDGGALTELSPVWYQPDEQGQIVFASREAQRSALAVEQQAASRGLAL